MKITRRLLIFPLFLVFVGSNRGAARTEPAGDPLGKRFLCSDAPTKRLCIPAILSGCRMTLEVGPGIPSEPGEKALLHQDVETHTVDGPNQLKGCVSILTEEQALEYLRFFSSLRTVHLFHDKMLEIYPASGKGCYLVCLPKDRWDSLKLPSPLVKKTDTGFRVTRLVIKPIPTRQEVTVFRLTQEVGTDGMVKELESVPVPLSAADLLWLGFPPYL
jgi:hypothetical protein